MARGAKKPAAARKRPATAVTNPYEPAPLERASMDAMIAEVKETPYPPRMMVTKIDGARASKWTIQRQRSGSLSS